MLLEHSKEKKPFCCIVRLAFMAGVWLRLFGGEFWICHVCVLKFCTKIDLSSV